MFIKRIILIAIVCSLIGCFGYRNSYNRKRHDIVYFKKNECEIPKFLDTTILYKKVFVKSIVDDRVYEEFNSSCLKFYSDCKVANFINYDLKDFKSLDPKKARMGFYKFDEGFLVTKLYFNSAQGGSFAKERFSVIDKIDTLILKSENYIEKFEKVKLPKEPLIFKPDW